jgi:hypothetical protein
MYKVNISQLVPMVYIEWEIKTGISRLRASIVPKKDKAHIQNKTVRNIFTPRDLTFRACFALINM